MKSRPSIEKVGLAIAVCYVVLQPLMLQNPLKPVLAYGLGSLQPVDVLLPFMVGWIVWFAGASVRSGELQIRLREYGMVLAFATVLLVATLLSGIAGPYNVGLLDFAKFAYLLCVLVFFLFVLRSDSTSLMLFRVLVYVSILYMAISLCFYVAAFFFDYSSNFAQIREGFPYLGRVVRLNGPMQPTSKIFGAYLLFFALPLMLGGRLIDRRVWWFAAGFAVVCALLTLGRVGAVAAVAIVLGAAAVSKKRLMWMSLLAFPVIAAALAIQVLTIWHFDLSHLTSTCDAPYAIEPQTQYFGWYLEPTMCQVSGQVGVTYSSYFLMKAVALEAWLSHPVFGIGVNQYVGAWRAAVGTQVPEYFVAYPFTMAQSTYLTLLAELGTFGFIAWTGLIGFLVWVIWRRRSESAAVGWLLVVWIACFLYAMLDLDVQNFRFVYVMLPLSAALAFNRQHKLGPNTHVAKGSV